MTKDNLDNYFKFTGLLLVFLLLVFDRDLAMIYMFIMLVDYFWYQSDNFTSFPIVNKAISRSQVYLESFAGLGLFLLISTQIVSVFQPQAISPGLIAGSQSIFELLATSTPLLQGSKFLTLIGWGVLVPIIETSFFNGRLLEGLATYAEEVLGVKIPLNKITGPLLVVIFVVSALATLFHITAKGLESIPLLITFIFFTISSLLVIRHRETRGATIMHVALNSFVVLMSMGVTLF